MVKYIPKIGDIILISFDPSLGHEQKGYRPALVISDMKYNEVTGFSVCLPITTKIKGYPFEVKIDPESNVIGAILVDQVKCMDLSARNYKFIERLNKESLQEVQEKLKLILGI